VNAQWVSISETYASCALTEHGQVPVSLLDLPLQITFVPLLGLGVGDAVSRTIHVDNLSPNEPYRFAISSAKENEIKMKFEHNATATLSADSKPTSITILRDTSVDTLEGFTFPGASIQYFAPVEPLRVPPDIDQHLHVIPGKQ